MTFLPYKWKRIGEDFHVIFYVTYVNYLRYVKVEIRNNPAVSSYSKPTKLQKKHIQT